MVETGSRARATSVFNKKMDIVGIKVTHSEAAALFLESCTFKRLLWVIGAGRLIGFSAYQAISRALHGQIIFAA